MVRQRNISYVTAPTGIGNRIIPMGNVLSLASELNCRPVMFWTAAPVLGGASFGDLFDTTDLPFELVEKRKTSILNTVIFRFRYFHFRRREIHKRAMHKMRSPLIRLQYDKWIRLELDDNRQYQAFRDRPSTDLLKYSRILITGSRILSYAYDLSWLKPAAHIAPYIVELKKQFAPNTVGVHIRGTDYIRQPPIEAIIEKMHTEVELDPQVKFFFASDGDKRGRKVVDTFGDRLIVYKHTRNTERKTIQGQENAVVDLFGLAATSRIIGMRFSTFASLAALIGNKPLLSHHYTRDYASY